MSEALFPTITGDAWKRSLAAARVRRAGATDRIRKSVTEYQRVQLKSWVMDEAARLGCSCGVIYKRIWCGKYPKLHLERINKRVVNVLLPAGPTGSAAEGAGA